MTMETKNESMKLLRIAISEAVQTILNEKKPGGGLTDLGALRRIQPLKWHGDVSRAISATGGDVADAADRLDISKRSLYAAIDDEPSLQTIKDEAEVEEEEDSKEKD